jgi:RNA polymerase II C-terminal domain phosphatase-like 3/4
VLLPALQRDEAVAGAEDSAALAELGAVLLGGLKALHVYSNTGQGRSMGGPAREPVQAAWQARERLLTAAQRKQLEGFVSSSKNFAALLDDKEPSPQPVRRDYVPAPRPQPQPKEKKQKKAVVEEEPLLPQLSKRQQKRLQAQQRADAEAAARAQRAAEAAAQQAAAPPPPPQQRGSDDAEAGQQNKRYKLTIRLGSGSLAALGEGAPAPAEAAPPPAPPLPPAPAAEDRQLAAALDEHWRWHEQQQTVQQQAGWSEQPAPPPEDAPGGWQQLAPLPGEQSSRPASAASALPPDAPAANGSAAAAAPPDLNSAALEHAASGSPAILELLGQGKLCLVLDLDHTLLNSATFTEVGPALDDLLSSRAAAEAGNLATDKRLLFRMDAIRMYTKLRPGVREFLAQASQYFQLWIHTNGNRAYADSVCRLLDPDGAYFGERIIAQGADRLDQMVPDQAKRLMQGLAEREAITVIVDDSHSVWAQHSHNLVAVERYIYFPSSRASLGLKGPSLLDAQRDEHPEQGMLMVALQVLMRVHGAVMAALRAPPTTLPSGELVFQNWDVRHALAQERQKVLAGVRLVFTRVIPLEQEPSSHPLWRLAESFGATCSGTLDAATTHVIAGASGTEKVLTARQMGKWVVTPAWLECSCILWKRANEDRFLVPL